MSNSDTPDNSSPPQKVGELLASSELARAVENQDFKLFLDHIPTGLAVSKQIDGQPRIVYANAAFEAMSGTRADDINGKDWDVLKNFHHEIQPSVTLTRAAAEGEDFLGIFRKEAVDGDAGALVQAYATAIENEDGVQNYRILALVDVSYLERPQFEEYEKQIRDQDLLLKELQHRVKNNLQLITALIRLETRNVKRGGEVDLTRLASRIESLSLLYRALETDSFGPELDLAHYLSQITAAFIHAHGVDGINLETRVSYAPVSVNVAMPVGLIVNELLMNAFKYAFVGREQGTITVECQRDNENQYVVAVSDDGIGLPVGTSWPAPSKLAALVVQTLRENAGNVHVRVNSAAGEGTQVRIVFTHVPPSARKN